MRYFCTLFDNLYVPRGLTLYRSLARHDDNFHLYILAIDDACFRLLKQMNLPHVTVIPLVDVETPALLTAKQGRTHAEYCWTLTAVIINHCLNKFDLPHCVYVDADIYFFSSPAPLFDNMPKNKSVLLSKHNYSPDYIHFQESAGIFCVEFIMFKNNPAGRKILTTWQTQCLESCFWRPEEKLCGDQKYLDEWPKKYKNDIHIMLANYHAAPWSLLNYKLVKKNNGLLNGTQSLIFFHFHDVKPTGKGRLLDLYYYSYYPSLKNFFLLYKPYFQEIKALEKTLQRKITRGYFYYIYYYYIIYFPRKKILSILKIILPEFIKTKIKERLAL